MLSDVRIPLRFVSLINERIQESQGQFKLAFKRETPGQQAVYLHSSQEEGNRRGKVMPFELRQHGGQSHEGQAVTSQ